MKYLILIIALGFVGCGNPNEDIKITRGRSSESVSYNFDTEIFESIKFYGDSAVKACWGYDKDRISQIDASNMIAMSMNLEILNYVARADYDEKRQYIYQVDCDPQEKVLRRKEDPYKASGWQGDAEPYTDEPQRTEPMRRKE